MVVKKQENQSLNEDSKYIVVTLAGDRKIILPIAEGFKFMEIMAGGIQVKSHWNDGDKIVEDSEEMKISFISEQKLKQMKFEATVDPEEK